MTAPAPLRVTVLLRRLRARPDGATAEQILGRCEQAALDAALSLRAGGAVVTAIALGPAAREEPALAAALAAGCARAIRVHDELLDGLDYLGVAQVLAAVARHVGFDLLVCGDRSQDELQGAVGPAVAEILAVPHVSGAVDLRVEAEQAILSRQVDDGVHTLGVALPLVVGVLRWVRAPEDTKETPADATPAAAAEDDRTPAATPVAKPIANIEELGLESLGVEARELTYRARLVGRAHPQRSGRNATLLGTAAELVARLREDRLLE